MEDFVCNLLILINIIGHISEYKINLDTIEFVENADILHGERMTTGASAGNKILQTIRNIYSHSNRALAKVCFSPISRKFRLIG